MGGAQTRAVSEPKTVGELMTGDPVVATVDTPLADAAAIMDFYRISGLPVVDLDGYLVGVVSQTDLLHARTTEPLWNAWPGLAVRHLMTRPAVTVTPDVSIEEAARLMDERRIHRLVVTAADGETPIGVLSVSDLVRAMSEWSE
jgi:Predicted transcriptional regulator, contains C-terminal CBS domains